MIAVFQYPIFSLGGDEYFVTVTADVDFAHEAERDQQGRETECSSGDSARIIDAHFDDGELGAKFDVDALPKAIIQEMQDLAIEEAKIKIEENEERFVWIAEAGRY